MRLGLGI